MEHDEQLDALLPELEALEDEARRARLLERCHELPGPARASVLMTLLSSPEKWHRDLAADVSNELGVDPLAEAEAAAVEAGEPVLALGFDEDEPGSVPSAEPSLGTPELVILEDPPVLPPTGERRHLAAALGALLVLIGVGIATSVGVRPASSQRIEEARVCWNHRQRLVVAAEHYRSDRYPENLAGSPFLSGQGFQDVLLGEGYLEEALRCPTIGSARAYSFEPIGDHAVRCRRHGSGPPRR